MKVLITGTHGLSGALKEVLSRDHHVRNVSKSSGYDINLVDSWASEFSDYDCCINCAYDGFGQLKVLESFYHMWRDHSEKMIVNIGSKVSCYARTETDKDHEYFRYRVEKQALESAFSSMSNTSRCDLKLINPGPIDTEMIRHLNVDKLDPQWLAVEIYEFIKKPYIKRVDLWQ